MTSARCLAAILSADVVGYSRLRGQNEAGTAKAVGERRDAAQPIVANLGGRIVKTAGDGVLLEFPSIVAAVECAAGPSFIQPMRPPLISGQRENDIARTPGLHFLPRPTTIGSARPRSCAVAQPKLSPSPLQEQQPSPGASRAAS